jgi:catechol 2,3-dioxygenase-like lactoylglutathione lyase family enzyme
MGTNNRIDPRIRAYGKARIDITRRAQDERQWQALWHEPRFPLPFDWGNGWKHCLQYTVDDFAAEIGFFIDVLGFPVNAFSPSYARFTTPGGEFNFGVSEAAQGGQSTPVETIRIQFAVKNLADVIPELQRRGVDFEQLPEQSEDGNLPVVAALRSPHGIVIELWETPEIKLAPLASQPVEVQPAAQPAMADFWADVEEEVELEAEQSEEPTAPETPVALDEDEISEIEEQDFPPDEPVYVDEDGSQHTEPLVSLTVSPPRPPSPVAIIRRVEDSTKGPVQLPIPKVRGNGLRGFPTIE